MLRKATRYGMKIVIGGWHARWHQSPAISRQNHRQHSPGMFGSLDRVQRTQFDGPSGGLCRLLSWNANSLSPGQRLSSTTCCATDRSGARLFRYRRLVVRTLARSVIACSQFSLELGWLRNRYLSPHSFLSPFDLSPFEFASPTE